ncbi:MAG: DEAD/DEAH box helicase family protein [Bacteroidales bacterium]|nr:DEAD/DEAH box helicase family protein [Bacteroidales bacterium]
MQLRDYQNEIADRGAELLARHKLCYLAMECRTGKTLTALACAARHGAKSVLAISKLKAIPSILADHAALNPPFDLDAVNYESAHKVDPKKYDLIILDEAHSLGSYPKPSKRAKSVKAICKGKPIIYLSGTPTPESYSQIYHQFWVSSYTPFKAYATFYKWAKMFVNVEAKMRNGTLINDYSNARKGMIDAVVKHLFIDYTQQEAGFTANIEEYVLEAPMGDWTRKALRTLERDKVLELPGGGVVLADTPAKLLGKLHQLSSGTVIDEDGNHHITDAFKALYIAVVFRESKKAIFYVYQTEAEMLKEAFPKWTDVPEVFQASDDPELVFLGQVRSAREGVRLDTADALIFFNLEYSYLSYEQGRNRLSSKERERPAQIYFLCSDCGIEADILAAVHAKTDYTYQWYKNKSRAL